MCRQLFIKALPDFSLDCNKIQEFLLFKKIPVHFLMQNNMIIFIIQSKDNLKMNLHV